MWAPLHTASGSISAQDSTFVFFINPRPLKPLVTLSGRVRELGPHVCSEAAPSPPHPNERRGCVCGTGLAAGKFSRTDPPSTLSYVTPHMRDSRAFHKEMLLNPPSPQAAEIHFSASVPTRVRKPILKPSQTKPKTFKTCELAKCSAW